MNKQKIIVFAAATYSLAETQRMVQIASEVKKAGIFHAIVAHYTPLDKPYSFTKIIKEEGLDDVLLTPHMTKELAEYIYAIDRGEKAGDFLPYNILKERVNNELDFFKSHNVICVVTGFCLSIFVSARILDIPVVSVLSGSMLWWMKQDPKLIRMPDMMSIGPIKLIPKKWALSMMNWVMNKVPMGLKGMNKILKAHNKKPFGGIMDFITGDIFFSSDIPEYIPIKEEINNFYYIGSLIGRLKADIPEEVTLLLH